MLCSLKYTVIISLFLSQGHLCAFDMDFVKRSHSLKETSLKETKEFLDSIPGPLESDKNRYRVSPKQIEDKTDLIKDAAHLLKKTFRLEDGLKNKDAMRPEFYIFISFSLPRKTLLTGHARIRVKKGHLEV